MPIATRSHRAAAGRADYRDAVTTALLTDLYELTMLEAARASGAADRHCVFEVFTRSLPKGRRYGVVAGTGRMLEAIADFRFDDADLRYLAKIDAVSDDTLEYLASYRFRGDVDAYEEGDLFFPGSPILRVEGSFADAVMLETVVLSILNHDSGVASVGARMVTAARGRPCIEMGGRRVHEDAAIAAARAAYIVGFASTSNLAAGAHYRIPVTGTSAHAFTLLFDDERDAFRAQLAAQGNATALLVDTYDVPTAVRSAVELAGPELGSIRLDSGDLGQQAVQLRQLLDSLGADRTRITVTSDLDEYRLEELSHAPVDAYGIGTRLVTGGGHPAPGFVYKLVERENSAGVMEPVGKRSQDKTTPGGAKRAVRMLVDGVARAEVVLPASAEITELDQEITAAVDAEGSGIASGRVHLRPLQVPMIRGGERVNSVSAPEQVQRARAHHAHALAELDLRADDGPDGPPAIPTHLFSVNAAQATPR